jgi:ADP-heptose:LPS heptosyltransferase
MKTKEWGMQNWQRYLEALVAAEPDIDIFLFDADARVAELCVNERIRTTSGYSIPQSIVFLQTCDLLVSIDSWTKYIAAAHGIPQVLIVPEQRSEYPQLTPEKLLREELAGIYGRHDTEVIGLTAGPSPTLTLSRLGDLAPECLLTETRRKLSTLFPK